MITVVLHIKTFNVKPDLANITFSKISLWTVDKIYTSTHSHAHFMKLAATVEISDRSHPPGAQYAIAMF